MLGARAMHLPLPSTRSLSKTFHSMLIRFALRILLRVHICAPRKDHYFTITLALSPYWRSAFINARRPITPSCVTRTEEESRLREEAEKGSVLSEGGRRRERRRTKVNAPSSGMRSTAASSLIAGAMSGREPIPGPSTVRRPTAHYWTVEEASLGPGP